MTSMSGRPRRAVRRWARGGDGRRYGAVFCARGDQRDRRVCVRRWRRLEPGRVAQIVGFGDPLTATGASRRAPRTVAESSA